MKSKKMLLIFLIGTVISANALFGANPPPAAPESDQFATLKKQLEEKAEAVDSLKKKVTEAAEKITDFAKNAKDKIDTKTKELSDQQETMKKGITELDTQAKDLDGKIEELKKAVGETNSDGLQKAVADLEAALTASV